LKVGGKKNELWERLKERVMMTQGATQNNNAKKRKLKRKMNGEMQLLRKNESFLF
jgi:hypothetical protein